MKMKIKLVIGCVFLSSLVACNVGTKRVEWHNVITLRNDTLPVPEYSLAGDTLPYDALWPTGIMAVDSFMLIAQHKEKDLIHVYNLGDTTKLGSFLQQGGGPNEVNLWNGFNQVWKENGEIKLLVQSYPQFVATLNLNQSLKKGKAVFDERFSFVSDSAVAIMARSNVVYKIGDRFLMNRAPDRIKGLENYNASYQWFDYAEDSPGDVVYAMDQPLYPHPYLYMNGGITYNPVKGKICSACRFLNLFYLFDVKTNQSVQIVPNNEETDLDAYVNAKKDNVYFQRVVSTDEYVYLATYDGLSQSETEGKGIKVEVYDWDGKHICCLLLPDNIYYMTVKPDNTMLYVTLPDGGMKSYRLPDFQ